MRNESKSVNDIHVINQYFPKYKNDLNWNQRYISCCLPPELAT